MPNQPRRRVPAAKPPAALNRGLSLVPRSFHFFRCVLALLTGCAGGSVRADDIDENFFLSAVRRAQSTPGLIAHSRSGQFVIARAPIIGPAPPRATSSAQPTLRYLVPELLAVSCERIRRQLLIELGVPESIGNKILIVIQPLRPTAQPIDIAVKRFALGWAYQLTISQQIEEEKVVRAIIQAVLLELANRRAGERSCEIPLWLTEGLTQQLLATSETDWILQPEAGTGQRVAADGGNAVAIFRQSGSVRQGVPRDPLFSAHRRLAENAPYTFTELSLPASAHLEGTGWEVYQSCAHLFVQRLFSFRDGRAKVRTMLALLPQCLNWQTAFLKAFEGSFTSMLDAEKWWALRLAGFTGRDHWQAWTRATSVEKLGATLHFPAQLATRTNDLPARSVMTPLSFEKTQPSWCFFTKVVISQLMSLQTRPCSGFGIFMRTIFPRTSSEG